jgi:AcrR family transcriptional regulator
LAEVIAVRAGQVILKTKGLAVRKQALVRDAIFDAAIDLFIRNGFNETTIDQIADAAGISQRSFFRYFATKADLLAYPIAAYGDVLVSAVGACAARTDPLEVVRRAAAAGIEFSHSAPRTREIIEITAQNIAARQAHKAATVEVEIRLSEAYAARIRNANKLGLEPRMLALLTLMVGDLAVSSWFVGQAKDPTTALKNVFTRLMRMFCESGTLRGAKSQRHRDGAVGSHQPASR